MLCSVASLLRISSGLADLNAEHVRAIRAALLFEDDRRRGHRETQVAEAVLDVDEDVLQRRAAADHDFLGGDRVRAVRDRTPSSPFVTMAAFLRT